MSHTVSGQTRTTPGRLGRHSPSSEGYLHNGLFQRSRFWKRVKIFLGGSDPDYPKPPMEDGEKVHLEGVGARFKGLFGGAWGPVLITNRRVIWYETANTWPLPKVSGEARLRDVVAVDKGTFIDFVLGGRRLRMHLRNGKTKTLYEGQGRLDEWVETIRMLIVQENGA